MALPDSAEYLIVGAGIHGLSCARRLVERRAAVIRYERRADRPDASVRRRGR